MSLEGCSELHAFEGSARSPLTDVRIGNEHCPERQGQRASQHEELFRPLQKADGAPTRHRPFVPHSSLPLFVS